MLEDQGQTVPDVVVVHRDTLILVQLLVQPPQHLGDLLVVGGSPQPVVESNHATASQQLQGQLVVLVIVDQFRQFISTKKMAVK